jgi:hypothetical protein
MTIRRRFLTTVSAAAIAAAGLVNYGAGQQPREKVDRGPKPPEVEVLDKLVGTWGPSTNNFKAMQAKWLSGDSYIQIDKRFFEADKVDTLTLIAWNKQNKAYRCWHFSGLDGGSPAQGDGSWDDKSKTLTFTCAPSAGGSRLVIAFTVNGDTLVYNEGAKNKAGKVDWALTCDWTKRKE